MSNEDGYVKTSHKYISSFFFEFTDALFRVISIYWNIYLGMYI